MPYVETTATRKIKRLKKRVRLLAGGTSASKTISALLYLITLAQTDNKPVLTSVVSESFPHLRRGAIRDFKNIMIEHNIWEPNRWSESTFTYTFSSGSPFEFFSSDQPSKVRGPRRGRLYANEVNNIPKEAWEQLLLRTTEFAIADWNPVSDFYMYEDYGLVDEPSDGQLPYASDPDVDFLVLTYKDNEALEPSIVAEIEKRINNRAWFRPYGLGLRGETEGKIFKDWYIEDTVPHEARLERRGLDFGYSNDPTAIVDVYYYNGGYILDEQLYQKGMSNKQIADVIKNLTKPSTMIVCDSSEPKSIDELRLYGVNAQGANKGAGSILQGIQYLQDQQISITERSVNLRKEYRNYMWKTDKEGKILNVPEDIWNHALDATRYAFESLRPKNNLAPVSPKWVKEAARR
jgi:phage terminase large subunit